jgi:hypothetical protein
MGPLGDLDSLLLIETDPGGRRVPETVWTERVERARKFPPRHYRSKARWSFVGPDGSGEEEWAVQLTEAEPRAARKSVRAIHGLELERCVEYLNAEVPDAVRSADDGQGLLQLHFANGNLARRQMTETPPDPTDRGTTVVWLDSGDHIVKTESSFVGTIDGESLKVKVIQAFLAYDD